MSLRRGIAVLAVAASAAAGTAAGPSAAAPAPARSGTILGGYFPGAAYLGPSPSGCAWVADCASWKLSGCRADLAGREPALHASIVRVRGLGSRTREWVFSVTPEPPVAGAPSLVWGGLTLELWGRDCHPVPLTADDAWQGVLRVESKARLRMDPAAEWLTVSSSDNTRVGWQLRRR